VAVFFWRIALYGGGLRGFLVATFFFASSFSGCGGAKTAPPRSENRFVLRGIPAWVGENETEREAEFSFCSSNPSTERGQYFSLFDGCFRSFVAPKYDAYVVGER